MLLTWASASMCKRAPTLHGLRRIGFCRRAALAFQRSPFVWRSFQSSKGRIHMSCCIRRSLLLWFSMRGGSPTFLQRCMASTCRRSARKSLQGLLYLSAFWHGIVPGSMTATLKGYDSEEVCITRAAGERRWWPAGIGTS